MAMRRVPSRRADYVFFREMATRWMDNDVYGHINNVVHYSLFDTAVNTWLIERGLLDPKKSSQIGLVAETGCRYCSEMSYPDIIVAGLRVGRIGTSSVRYEIGLFRNNDDVAAAEGFFVHVYVNSTTRRPEPIAAPLRAALETLLLRSEES